MRKHLIALFFVLLFALYGIKSVFHPGFMYSHDSLWHVERIQNMFSLLPTQFPVRWSPSLDNGYGVPLFNFTYPAPYYLGAALMYLGFGPIKSYDLIILSFYLLGGIGVYCLGSKKPWIGVSAAILYLFTPYQFLDIFVRGALGEIVALGLMPWVILSYERVSQSGKLHWYAPLPLALLFLSHNFFAYIFTALLIFLIIFLYRYKKILFASLFLSFTLSAFFLLPAYAEKGLLLYSRNIHQSFRDHFVFPIQLIYGQWSFTGSMPGKDPKEMSYQLGIAHIATLILSLATLRRSKKLAVYFSATTLTIFMMLKQSDLLWQYIPLISSIQFPWRFLGITSILIPLMYIELCIVSLQSSMKIWSKYLSVLLVVIAVYAARHYTRPVKWMSVTEFTALHYAYVGKTTTAQREEIVPYWAYSERYDAGNTPSLDFTYTSDSATTIVVERNYFPTWAATMDDKKIPLSPTSTGAILLPISPGTHAYKIFQQSTNIQIIGNLISLISLASLYFIYTKNQCSQHN